MTDEPSGLVGVAWVSKRTGLGRTTIKRAAADGRIPGATKLLELWRFDVAELERWIAANTTSQPMESGRVQAEPARPTPTTERQRGQGFRSSPPESTPPLAILFQDAPWRGIYDELPARKPARSTAARRRGRATKTASPR